MAAVDAAIRQASRHRRSLGSMIVRLTNAAQTIAIRAENELAAQSLIADMDMAAEAAALMRKELQAQLAIASSAHGGVIAKQIRALIGE